MLFRYFPEELVHWNVCAGTHGTHLYRCVQQYRCVEYHPDIDVFVAAAVPRRVHVAMPVLRCSRAVSRRDGKRGQGVPYPDLRPLSIADSEG